jgi:endonuclease-3
LWVSDSLAAATAGENSLRGGLSVAAMKPKPEDRIFVVLKRFVRQWDIPSVHHFKGDPFRVLISCLLSQRTLEHVTLAASRRLFARADTPRALRRLSVGEIAVLIATVRYARTKAQWIHAIALGLEQRSDRVPDTLDALLELPGVGRKTANLVLAMGYDKPGICVDTHVHRVTNRWGYVRTRTPDETEQALRAKLPKRYWKVINTYLVPFGKHHCQPLSPKCSTCPLLAFCDQVGVTRRR